MQLGTPLSPAAVKVMLLGSGELGKEVAIELQRLGVETIAVDRYPNAPAMQVAHRAHVIDMTDAKALRALVEQGLHAGVDLRWDAGLQLFIQVGQGLFQAPLALDGPVHGLHLGIQSGHG